MYISTKGNKKLKNSGDIKFLIWSLPPIITCPNKTKECSKKCYALKSQRLYPNTRNSRALNFEYSQKDSFVDIMNYKIDEIKRNKTYKGKKIYFRIHESGDFYNKEYFDKWIKIINNHKDIQFACYTKSFNIIGDDIDNLPKNFIVRGSLWNDTPQIDKDYIKKHNLPIFTALDKVAITETNIEICGGSCGIDCLKCYENSVDDIAIQIH